MEETDKSVVRERIIAGLLAVAGMFAFLLSLRSAQLTAIPFREYLLAFLFTASVVAADQFPVHLSRGTKLSLINLPIFLATALLPTPLAISVTGLGLLAANLLARAERGLLPRDIASTSAQWMLTVFLGSQILHANLPVFSGHTTRLGLLLLCALLFLFVDFLIFSLSQALIYGEPFVTILISVIKQGFSLELMQYLLAVLGVLAAEKDLWSLLLLFVPISIMHMAFKNIKETRYETIQVLKEMADTVDLRDTYTGGHSKEVVELVHQLLARLKITGPEASLIETSASLHDIGKLGIPDHILLKPGPLSPEERAAMQTHTRKGAELISKYKDFSRGALMILHHHERWDGQGYPAGLKEHDIPFGARVIAVADSFDAMTSDRPYRKAMSVQQAIETLLDGRGKQWDPAIVDAFVGMISEQIAEERMKSLAKTPEASAASETLLVSS